MSSHNPAGIHITTKETEVEGQVSGRSSPTGLGRYCAQRVSLHRMPHSFIIFMGRRQPLTGRTQSYCCTHGPGPHVCAFSSRIPQHRTSAQRSRPSSHPSTIRRPNKEFLAELRRERQTRKSQPEWDLPHRHVRAPCRRRRQVLVLPNAEGQARAGGDRGQQQGRDP
ncbi:hypothetical protein EI94DRAFT_956237 [Lactarius quietus]|nr:hypothetical protein EI94DRAFT_956237 [Lactarius quietus]